MSNRFTSFRLYEMHKLIPVFQFTSQFSLIRAPSSRKPIVVPGASFRKLIFVLRVFALRAVLEKRIKFVNRGITVYYHTCKKNAISQLFSFPAFRFLLDVLDIATFITQRLTRKVSYY
jgi:hypothetical protein